MKLNFYNIKNKSCKYSDVATLYRGYFKGNTLDRDRSMIGSISWYCQFLTIYWNGKLHDKAVKYFYWLFAKDSKDYIKEYFESNG